MGVVTVPRSRFMTVGILFIVAVVASFSTAMTARAHSVVDYPPVTSIFCLGGILGPYSQTETVSAPPGDVDKTWVVKVFLALDAGGEETDTRWVFRVEDSLAPSPVGIANYRDQVKFWTNIGVWVHADTMTAHAGGQLSVTWTVIYEDTGLLSECYHVGVYLSYYSSGI